MQPHIAFDRLGDGPPVILVLGAFNTRATGAPLAAALAAHHTVFNYDRRGRGDSGDSDGEPYAVEREIEDLDGLIQRAGGSAAVFGFSSGAALTLAAAAHGLAITRLALFDLPLRLRPPAPGAPTSIDRAATVEALASPAIGAPAAAPVSAMPLDRAVALDTAAASSPVNHAAALDALVCAGRRGDAVEYFQLRMVGLPEPLVAQLRHAPFRHALEAMAHTLVYDATLIGNGHLSLDQARKVRAPTLAIAGGKAPPFMRETAEALARTVPDGRALILDGIGHDLVPDLLAPPLLAFLAGRR